MIEATDKESVPQKRARATEEAQENTRKRAKYHHQNDSKPPNSRISKFNLPDEDTRITKCESRSDHVPSQAQRPKEVDYIKNIEPKKPSSISEPLKETRRPPTVSNVKDKVEKEDKSIEFKAQQKEVRGGRTSPSVFAKGSTDELGSVSLTSGRKPKFNTILRTQSSADLVLQETQEMLIPVDLERQDIAEEKRARAILEGPPTEDKKMVFKERPGMDFPSGDAFKFGASKVVDPSDFKFTSSSDVGKVESPRVESSIQGKPGDTTTSTFTFNNLPSDATTVSITTSTTSSATVTASPAQVTTSSLSSTNAMSMFGSSFSTSDKDTGTSLQMSNVATTFANSGATLGASPLGFSFGVGFKTATPTPEPQTMPLSSTATSSTTISPPLQLPTTQIPWASVPTTFDSTSSESSKFTTTTTTTPTAAATTTTAASSTTISPITTTSMSTTSFSTTDVPKLRTQPTEIFSFPYSALIPLLASLFNSKAFSSFAWECELTWLGSVWASCL
eukprot:TRINITY_DN7108_c0_g2_i3.p1 TRINITY_DN7108_c0_g2~~TRINITY_DN7108_c0_g2_i3.p1  ORF type:complete len:505 (-),score=104.26 TRINITY_DN7108_c0_g2_i3:451-1965(-)